MQELLKMYSHKNDNIELEIRYATHTLTALPTNGWILATHKNFVKEGKNEIYDALLHKRDVSYSIELLMRWINDGGLYFIDFDLFIKRLNLKSQYETMDPRLKKMTMHFDDNKVLYLAEILKGNHIKHSFYASKARHSTASFRDESNVLYLYGNPIGLKAALMRKSHHRMRYNESFFMATMYEFVVNNYRRIQGMNQYNISLYRAETSGVSFGWKISLLNSFLVMKVLDSSDGIALEDAITEYMSLSKSNNHSKKVLHMLAEDFYRYVKDTEIFLLKKQFLGVFPKTNSFSMFQIDL